MNRAFTMIEVVVVTVVIGILAAMVIPKFASAQQETTVAATAEDLRVIARALTLYQGVHGSYPPGGSRADDAEALETFFKGTSPFEIQSPIGGVYDYDGYTPGVPISVSIIQDGSNRYSFEQAIELDEYLDNGDLGSGKLMEVGDKLRYRFYGNKAP